MRTDEVAQASATAPIQVCNVCVRALVRMHSHAIYHSLEHVHVGAWTGAPLMAYVRVRISYAHHARRSADERHRAYRRVRKHTRARFSAHTLARMQEHTLPRHIEARMRMQEHTRARRYRMKMRTHAHNTQGWCASCPYAKAISREPARPRTRALHCDCEGECMQERLAHLETRMRLSALLRTCACARTRTHAHVVHLDMRARLSVALRHAWCAYIHTYERVQVDAQG